MNTADLVILSVIAVFIAVVVLFMKKQKKNGSGCHAGCAGCSKAKSCSSNRYWYTSK